MRHTIEALILLNVVLSLILVISNYFGVELPHWYVLFPLFVAGEGALFAAFIGAASSWTSKRSKKDKPDSNA
jgi:hypothetical protein